MNITSTDGAEHVAALLAQNNNKVSASKPEDKPKVEDKNAPDSETGDEDQTGDETSDDSAEGDEGKKAKKPEKADKRIAKITKEKSDTARERDYWKTVALEGKKPTNEDADKKVQKKPELKKPNSDDFDKQSDYYEALADYKVALAKEDIRKEILQEQEAEKQRDKQGKILSKWQEKLTEARERYEDFDEVTDNDTPLDKAGIIEQTFLTSPVGADMCYWWGNHPEEAKKLVKMEPVALARELGRIEARIEAELKPADEVKDKKLDDEPKKVVVKKPKPVEPVKGGSSGNVTRTIYDTDLTDKQWRELRNKQKRSA